MTDMQWDNETKQHLFLPITTIAKIVPTTPIIIII
jgi:hypothetical protein